MNIRITTGLYPPDIGGPATYVPRIATALALRGHTVGVIAPQAESKLPGSPDFPYGLVRFQRARSLRYLNFFIELGRAFRAIFRESKDCDLIYVNGLDVAAWLVNRLAGRPLVVKVVGDGAWELAYDRGWTTLNLDNFQDAPGLRFAFFRTLRHLAARQAHAVIVPSRYLAGIVQKWGVPAERIHVIYNALDSSPASGQKTYSQTQAGPLRLVTVGRLVAHKRIEAILEVLAQGFQGADLTVVGDGPERANLEAKAQMLGVAERVHFPGHLPHSRVQEILENEADIFILNSTYEGFPHVLLEAAQSGLPVVATCAGGTPEIVLDGQTGILIPPGSPGALLSALRRLGSDAALRQRLGENARRELNRFSFSRMVAETERVLLEAMK